MVLFALVCFGITAHGADSGSNQNFAKMSGTPQSRVQAPPGELKLGKTVWSEVSTMATNVAPRKSKHKAASSLKGKTIRAAEFYTLSSGERKLNPGGLVTFNYTTDNTASVKGLGTYANKLTMSYDLDAGTVSISPQVVYVHPTYGNVYICPIDWSQGAYSTTSPVTGTIDDKGNITLGAWGLFLTSGPNKGGSFLATKGSKIWASNGVMTNKFQGKDSLEVYPIYVERQFDNQIGIVNFADNGTEVSAYVNPDKSIEITPQHIYTNPSYGEFVCKPANWSGAGVLSGSINGTSTPSKITLGNWAIVSRVYTALVAYSYASSEIELTDYTLTYPTQRQLSWTGNGTSASPFVIASADQLQAFAESVNYGNDYAGKYITLGGDIDMTTLTSAYRSIGRSEQSPFKGNFNGQGHTIKNLTITYGQESNAGLFGCVGKGGVITNLNIDNLKLTSAGQFAGGAVAQANEAEISKINVTNSTITHTNSWGGGVVGELSLGTISNCRFTGSITGSGATGGVVGILRGATASDCSADATMVFDGYFDRFYRALGGVAGYIIAKKSNDNSNEVISPLVTDSYFSGTITDNDGHGQVAGVVGDMNGGTVERCFNAAPIASVTTDELNGAIGGVAGLVYGATIKDSFSANEILSSQKTKQVGGIVGYILGNEKEPTTIENCYNAGQVIVASGYPTYAVYGVRFQPSTLKNVFFDKQMTPATMPDSLAAMAKTTAELTSAQGIAGFDKSVWTFTDGFYPVLTKFKDVPVAQMATAPLILANGESVNKIKTNFSGAVTGTLKWYIYNNNQFGTEGNGLTVDANGKFTLKNVTSHQTIGVTPDSHNYKLFSIYTVNPSGFVGSGTQADPYLIQDKEDLVNLNNYVKSGQNFKGDFFTQTKDIDLNYSDDFKGVGDDYKQNHAFAGTYDGQGHTIHRMKIDGVVYDESGKAVYSKSRRVGGLFGYTTETSVLKNINIAADCKIEVYEIVGGVVGATQGRVENCRNYADITAITDNAGGIAGQVTSTGAASGCYNSGTITAGGNTVGGIVAVLGGKVEYCQNDGEVRNIVLSPTRVATALNTAGGIAGEASGSAVELIGNVNTGYVHSLRDVGGISSSATRAKKVACNLNYGMVDYHYTDGTVGSFFAYKYTGDDTAGNCFDAQIGYQNAACYTALNGISGLTTAELTSGKKIDGLLDSEHFDFTEGMYPVLKAFKDEPAAIAHRQMIVKFAAADNCDNMKSTATLSNTKGMEWALAKSADFAINGSKLTVALSKGTTSLRDTLTVTFNGYQKALPLRAVPALFDGEGTAQSPYLIKNVEDMQTLGQFSTNENFNFAGNYFRLVNDLDFKGEKFYPVALPPTLFEGDFDGNGKKLSNVTYTTDEDYAGVFSNVGKSGCVHDLTLASGTITGYRYPAGIANSVYGKIYNCTNGATITTEKYPYAGGVVAHLYSGGSIIGCSNYGNVAPASGSGAGIVCNTSDGSLVKDCVNNGKFTDNYSMAGIVCSNYGKIVDCVNKGTISGSGSLAGIVVESNGGDSVINCRNEATIRGTSGYIGGVVATTKTSDKPSVYINCYNTASISGKEIVGGFVGIARVGVEFNGCYNTGDVTGDGSSVGGFIGSAYSSSTNTGTGLVINCYNSGQVSNSNKYTGGFAGDTGYKFNFINCHNDGYVISNSYGVGGFAGNLLGNATNCYNTGEVESDGYGVGGFAGLLRNAAIKGCFNVGNVTSNSTITDGSHGNAGGLSGEGYGKISDSFNMGNVVALSHAAGVLGMANSSSVTISRCYNTGSITVSQDGTAGAIQVPGKRYKAALDSVFFDSETCTGLTDANAKALTTVELTKADLGSGFATVAAAYPLPQAFVANDTVLAYAAAYALADGETSQHIKSKFRVITPEGLKWTSSSNLSVAGPVVATSATGAATLTKTFGSWTRTFKLSVDAVSGVDDTNVAAKTVASRTYFTVAGVQIATPANGEIVIERVTYTDGTSATRKTIYRNK